MKKEALYKYYVVKLEHPPNKCLSKYLCVRRSWTHKADEDTKDPNIVPKDDYGRVQAWYPFEMNTKRVKGHTKPDLNEGGMYMARVKYKTDVYKDAKAWIYLVQKSEKNKINNEHNVAVTHSQPQTTETNAPGGDQSSNEEELSSTSENYDKQVSVDGVSDSTDMVIVEDSKDHEPVTSSSSPNNTPTDPDVQKQDNILVCLIESIQSVLKKVEIERKEQFRFEFDEIRIIRVNDNNLLDRLLKLTINGDDINCAVSAADLPAAQREAEVVTEKTKTLEAPEAATSSLPVVRISQSSTLDHSFSSVQIAASRPEYVTPSSGRTTHIELPITRVEPHTVPTNAFNHIPSLAQSYTAVERTPSNVERSLPQNSSIQSANDYPYVTIQPSHPLSYHPSPQLSVLTPVISSTTNYVPKPHILSPTVTVRSPDEINKRIMSKNSSPMCYGSVVNERTYPQHLSTPIIVYPNIAPDNRVSTEFPSSQTWATPAIISAMPTTNVRPPDEINKRVTYQNLSNFAPQFANRINYRRFSQQTSVPSALVSSLAMSNSRPTSLESHPTLDPVYGSDDLNKRLTSQNSSNVTLLRANRLNSKRYSHQTLTPAIISPMATERSIPQVSRPVVSYVSPDVTITPQYYNTPVGSDSVTNSPQIPSVVTSASNEIFTARSSVSPHATTASFNDYFVRSLSENISNIVSQNYDTSTGNKPVEPASRKRAYSSNIREPFVQNENCPVKKALACRHSTSQREGSKKQDTIVID